MKKVISFLFIFGSLIFFFSGCHFPHEKTPLAPYITFEEVSQPYMDLYGEPDVKDDQGSDVYWTWDLGYKMLEVHFSDSGSWKVESEEKWSTFAQVTQPYLDLYGEPDNSNTNDQPEGHRSVDWTWWSHGKIVGFTTYFFLIINPWDAKSWYVSYELTITVPDIPDIPDIPF